MKRLRLKLLFAAAAVLVTAVVALAFYSAPGTGANQSTGTTGSFTAATITMPSTSNGSNVVTWSVQASLSNSSKNSQITYRVKRQGPGDSSFTDVPVTSGCAGDLPRPTANCTDAVGTSGSYSYRVVAKYSGWSANSNDVTVAATVGSPPSAPTTVALANGGGVGTAYINDTNKASLSVNVGLPASSSASDTVHVTITDGTNTTTDKTATATAGAGTVQVTGINATSLNDGSVTIRATSSNASGTSGQTTVAVTKDTVKPTSGAGTVANITSGNTFTVPYTSGDTSPSATLEKVELYVDTPTAGTNFTMTNTDTSPSASDESFTYTGATTDGTYSFYTLAYDKAGNVETAKTVAERTATRTTAPVINDAVIVKTEGRPDATAGQIRQNAAFFVYADVTPVSGSVISSVSANVSQFNSQTGSSAVALPVCPANCTVNGHTYTHLSASRTSSNPLAVGTKGFSVTANDNLGRMTTRGDTTINSSLTVNVDNTRPLITSVATSGNDNGVPEQGETMTFGYDSPVEGTSLFSEWAYPFAITNVRVSFVHRGNNNDQVTLQGGLPFATQVNIGTIDLGSANYVNGAKNNDAVFFGGTRAGVNSTIQRVGNSIVVTIGSANGGDVGAALVNPAPGSSIVTWSGGSGGAYDAAGNLVNNSTPTVTTGALAQAQF